MRINNEMGLFDFNRDGDGWLFIVTFFGALPTVVGAILACMVLSPVFLAGAATLPIVFLIAMLNNGNVVTRLGDGDKAALWRRQKALPAELRNEITLLSVEEINELSRIQARQINQDLDALISNYNRARELDSAPKVNEIRRTIAERSEHYAAVRRELEAPKRDMLDELESPKRSRSRFR